jgi:hypothetical protein
MPSEYCAIPEVERMDSWPEHELTGWEVVLFELGDLLEEVIDAILRREEDEESG